MRRVLLISPTDLAADLGRTVLWRNDVERAFAPDARRGHDTARSWAPNLVVVDGTERDDAERSLRLLRGDAATRQTAIAVVSRQPLLADASAFRKAGFNIVLPPQTNPLVWDAHLEELLNVPRRREARIAVRLEPWSRKGDGGDVIEGKALNISVNGLLLESSSPLDVGQKLDLRFRLPGSDAEFQAVGEVVRQPDRPRAGIKFIMLRGDARDAIGAFVEGGTAASGASKSSPAIQEDLWEAELRAAETLKAAILESSLDAVIIMTHEGRIIDINNAAEATLGYRRAEMIGRTITETIAPPSEADPARQLLAFALATANPAVVGQRVEMTVVGADGGEVPVELTTTVTPVKGRPFYTAFLRDLRAARRAAALDSAARRISEASAVAEGLEDLCKGIHMFVAEVMSARALLIALRDPSSGSLIVPYAGDAIDLSPAAAEGRHALVEHVRSTGQSLRVPSAAFTDLVARAALPDVQGRVVGWLGVPLKKHGQSIGVVALELDDPTIRFTDEDERALTLLSHAIAVAVDRKQAEARIHYLAYHDGLTGLPNRHLLLDRLRLGIAQAARDGNHLGLLLVDLDRFKDINESLGHLTGDQLIHQTASRLLRHIRKGDTLARVGADEFAVVIRALRDPADAAKVAHILQAAVAEPLEIDGRELFVTACVGISTFPGDGADVESLLKSAGTALHRAKEQGHESFRLYDPSMNAEAVQRLKLEQGLRRALERDELVTYYQPVIDLATGAVHGVEALLRWRHPERGLVLPGEFISMAETTGMIRPIGSWGLRAACFQARAWREQGHPGLSVAVNLSARQLHHMNVVAEVTNALRETGLAPESLELEITETSAMVNAAATIRALEALKALGVRLSIDDFGVGYSSMSQLQRLPIDTIKIDQSFIRDLTIDPDDAAIVVAMITLGHQLKLSVVAEGVETHEQLLFLGAEGCDRIQGFVFSPAVPAEECSALLAAHRADPWRLRRP